MTTRVTVEANHGWPVKVTDTRDGSFVIVEPNQKVEFAVWNGKDLLIHEIQPNEEGQA